jgi:DNA invertase Pin-like site-specific DNA recombinase
VLPFHYDDGGFSGGTLDRPALKQLLTDINDGKVDTVVVYKVDRLTRSLADFAKIIEAFDAREISFVSVTQQFNTTTSMGRLTLNVLLSFAQFEREVTGERIRDKIAASKKKGMWMGGFVPLGYDLKERRLVPNPPEVQLVSKIFRLYLELGCVSKVKQQLDREGIRSKLWVSRTGTNFGGNRFSRGALYDLLRSRLYIGEIRHRKTWYPGQHPAIVPQEMWDQAQAKLSANNSVRTQSREARCALLTGLIRDAEGNLFTPSHTRKKGRKYTYYVSQSVIRYPGTHPDGPIRLPAQDIESKIVRKLQAFLHSGHNVYDQLRRPEDDAAFLQRLVKAGHDLLKNFEKQSRTEFRGLFVQILNQVVVRQSSIDLFISKSRLRNYLAGEPSGELTKARSDDPADVIQLTLPSTLKRCGMDVRFVIPPDSALTPTAPKKALVNAIARAHEWYGWVTTGEASGPTAIARRTGLNERYVSKVFRYALLAPDIAQAILEGRHPEDLSFKKLWHNLPLEWVEHRRALGFPCWQK